MGKSSRALNQIHETRDNNTMHAKPDLRVFLKWMIAGSGSVIVDVIMLGVRSNLRDKYEACFLELTPSE
jgi:hypothetical protein